MLHVCELWLCNLFKRYLSEIEVLPLNKVIPTKDASDNQMTNIEDFNWVCIVCTQTCLKKKEH